MSAARPLRRTQEERSALSDQRMIAAAISLVVEVGVPGMTLAAIGERSGYSRGLVTHRYGSKSGLLAQVYIAAVHQWLVRVQVAVGDAGGLEALLRVVDALHGFLVESPREIRAMYLLRYSSIDPGVEYRDIVVRNHRAQRRDAQRWVEAGQRAGDIRSDLDATILAELFCATLDGIAYRWLIAPDVPVDRLREQLVQQTRTALAPAAR